jgi:integrase
MADWIRRYEAALFVERGAKIGDLADAYFADRKREGKYIAGIEQAWKALKGTFEHKTPDDINAPELVKGELRTICHRYAVEREDAGMRRASIHHELNCLRTILNWAAKPNRRLIPAQVGVWVPPNERPRRNEISPAQFAALMAECKLPHLRLYVLLAIFTAQRRTAILELTWSRVNFDKRTIDFRGDDRRKSILDTGGKKGRSVVDMPDSLFKVMQDAYLWRRTANVIEYAGSPVKDIKTALNKAMERAGLKKKGDGQFIGSHALRKSAATWLADQGMDMRKIQKLLGHEAIETTEQIYAGQSAGYLTPAVDALDRAISANILSDAPAATRALPAIKKGRI